MSPLFFLPLLHQHHHLGPLPPPLLSPRFLLSVSQCDSSSLLVTTGAGDESFSSFLLPSSPTSSSASNDCGARKASFPLRKKLGEERERRISAKKEPGKKIFLPFRPSHTYRYVEQLCTSLLHLESTTMTTSSFLGSALLRNTTTTISTSLGTHVLRS